VENDNTALRDVTTPVIPILLHGPFPVISVNQQEIDRPVPAAHRILAEGFNPDNLGPPRGTNRTLSRTAQEIKHGHSGEMKRIHKVQRAFRIHRRPQGDRGSALSNTDFYQAPASTRVPLKRVMFRFSVLSSRRTQPSPREKRVLHCPRLPVFGAWVSGVNVHKSDFCFRHADSLPLALQLIDSQELNLSLALSAFRS
jgi:hypothetical protein